MRTHVDGSIGQDHLLRARFDLDLPGALPVAEVGFAAVGRSFGFPDADAAEDLWTLDSPAHTWAGLSATAKIALHHAADGTAKAHAIGVAELIESGGRDRGDQVRALLAALVAKGVTATCSHPDGPRYGSLDVDSNLPDVRIVLGAGNTFAQRVLDSAGPAYRYAFARHGRVFVPAYVTRRELWEPGVDLRGARDLPVLIVDSAEELIEDLADAVIDVTVPAGLDTTAEPADDYSVAVVNRGTPGFVVDAGGAMYVSLMRACSGWPVGVWIDGERRTVPDGSSFAWQHWSHTFELSLLAGAGDWREAGFSRAGQDVNHPVRARQVSAGPGALPPELSLMSVEPQNVLLTALKASGDPLASGSAEVAADVADSITVRVYEASGTAAAARVMLHSGVESAQRTDLLEEREETLSIDEGRALIQLGAADIATVRLKPVVRPEGAGVEIVGAGEPVQPVFTRYWRHNNGPAPRGNLPAGVYANPSRLHFDGDAEQAADVNETVNATVNVTVTVSCNGRGAAGRVELAVPPGLLVSEPVDLDYRLEAGEFTEFTVPVLSNGSPGRYLLGARIRDDLGQILEDTVDVLVGAVDSAAGGDLVELWVEEQVVELGPGGVAELAVTLVNRARSEIRGEVALISPYGTWDGDLSVGPRIQPFTLAAGQKDTVRMTVRAATTARAGAHWWALVRTTCHGELHYSPAVELRIAG
jgi:hypothetical protein